MMVLLLLRDCLVKNSLTCLNILSKISVSCLNQESRENHPSLKLLLGLLSRFKLVASFIFDVVKVANQRQSKLIGLFEHIALQSDSPQWLPLSWLLQLKVNIAAKMMLGHAHQLRMLAA
jgi:hypothetical protein